MKLKTLKIEGYEGEDTLLDCQHFTGEWPNVKPLVGKNDMWLIIAETESGALEVSDYGYRTEQEALEVIAGVK